MEYSTLVLPPQAEECSLGLRFRDTLRRTDCFDDVSPDAWEKDEEFIRRFLQHVLPRGFVKVRYYSSSLTVNNGFARFIVKAIVAEPMRASIPMHCISCQWIPTLALSGTVRLELA